MIKMSSRQATCLLIDQINYFLSPVNISDLERSVMNVWILAYSAELFISYSHSTESAKINSKCYLKRFFQTGQRNVHGTVFRNVLLPVSLSVSDTCK